MKITVGVFFGVLALCFAAFLYMSREPFYPPHTPAVSDAAWGLDEKVGWYEFGPGDRGVLSYAADGGLKLYAYSDRMHSSDVRPSSDGSFEWQREGDTAPVRVTFERDDAGGISGLTWREGDTEHRAVRVADAPYDVRGIEYANGDVTLSATAFAPRGAGPRAAAVIIHGSGNSTRDNWWYTELSDYLARNDIAIVFPDKRGTGKSTGTWQVAGFGDFARDTVAGVEAARNLPGVDPARVGLLGISQGGWIAPLAASLDADIAFIVDLCGSTVTPKQQLLYEERQTLRQSGLPGVLADLVSPLAAWYPRRVRGTWWEKNGDFDPIPYWRDSGRPAFIAYGNEDAHDNVPIDAVVARVEKLQAEHPEIDLTLKLYEGSGHDLEEPGKENIRKDFLEELASWIHEKTSGTATARLDS